MLKKGVKVHAGTDLFKVPFGPAMQWQEFSVAYPEINTMTGETPEDCLLFYYQFNLVSQIYEFQDENAENDIAEILGICFNTVSTGETAEDYSKRSVNSMQSGESTRARQNRLCKAVPDKRVLCKKQNDDIPEITEEELEKLDQMGVSLDEYITMSNPNSMSSHSSQSNFEDSINAMGGELSAKEKKRLRRKLKVQMRDQTDSPL